MLHASVTIASTERVTLSDSDAQMIGETFAAVGIAIPDYSEKSKEELGEIGRESVRLIKEGIAMAAGIGNVPFAGLVAVLFLFWNEKKGYPWAWNVTVGLLSVCYHFLGKIQEQANADAEAREVPLQPLPYRPPLAVPARGNETSH